MNETMISGITRVMARLGKKFHNLAPFDFYWALIRIPNSNSIQEFVSSARGVMKGGMEVGADQLHYTYFRPFKTQHTRGF